MRRRWLIGLVLCSLASMPGWAGARGEEEAVLRGSWIAATESGRSFRGRWIGQALPGEPNALHGSWTLADNAGKTILSGTWSARKPGRRWRGTWSAEDEHGRRLSGTWDADLTEARGTTLEQLLLRTLETEISGAWQTGGRHGRWWLKGRPPAAGKKQPNPLTH